MAPIPRLLQRLLDRVRGARPPQAPGDPFETLIVRLRGDGLTAEAAQIHTLRNEMAWTTGSELLGELGLALKRIRKTVRAKASPATKEAFRQGARAVHKTWPFL